MVILEATLPQGGLSGGRTFRWLVFPEADPPGGSTFRIAALPRTDLPSVVLLLAGPAGGEGDFWKNRPSAGLQCKRAIFQEGHSRLQLGRHLAEWPLPIRLSAELASGRTGFQQSRSPFGAVLQWSIPMRRNYLLAGRPVQYGFHQYQLLTIQPPAGPPFGINGLRPSWLPLAPNSRGPPYSRGLLQDDV